MKINYERPEVLEIALEAQNILCGSELFPTASPASIEDWQEEKITW